MSVLTLTLGALLIVIGVGGYAISGGISVTALIPSFMGLPILLLGGIARRPRWRRRALHIAAALAFLGVIGSVQGVVNLIGFLFGTELARPLATASQALTAVLCAVYFILALRSFVNARVLSDKVTTNDEARQE